MGLTNFPNGVSSFGMPVMPGVRNIFGNVWFVNGNTGAGSDSNNGKSTQYPVATIGKAVSLASAYDTIYVKPVAPGTDASDPGVYEENVEIPYAKHGMSLIGVHYGNPAYGPKVRNDAAGYVFDVLAPNTLISGFNVHRYNSNSGTGGIRLRGEATWETYAGSQGSMIHNCAVRYAQDADSGGPGILIEGGLMSAVKGCFFTNCDTNIHVSGVGATRGIQLVDCDFMSHSGTPNTTDPMVQIDGPQSEFLMKGCHFDQATVFFKGVGAVDGIASDCYFKSTGVVPTNGGTNIDIGTGSLLFSGCYDASGELVKPT